MKVFNSIFSRRGIASFTSLVCSITLSPLTVHAKTPNNATFLLAQQVNGTIANLQCGKFAIKIAFVGPASSNTYSYRTQGLFLRNGREEGNNYIFNNNDYEYRVTILEGGSERRDFGTGILQVFHYGERVLKQQCTWN